MTRFTNRHVVVTGATSGIGHATALRLAEEGATVLATGRDPQRLETLGKADGVIAVANDAALPTTGTALREAVDTHLDGRVDGLFLNAGRGSFTPGAAIDAADVAFNLDVNLRAPLLHLAALDGALTDGASVLFNTSIVNDKGFAGMAAYSASKGAVRSAMQAIAQELAPRGVRVNAVSPGPIGTNFFTAAGLGEEEIEEMSAGILAAVPLGRFGTPGEVAAGATFLLSPEASFVTGTELVIDGGIRS